MQARTPNVTPLPGKPALLIGAYEPSDVGYTASEFVISGEAASYAMSEPASADGHWRAAEDDTADYATRIVVWRPTDPARFDGTVIVEWLNVTGGVDSPADWLMLHRQVLRAGHAYVMVSAQQVGVEGGPSIMGPDNSLKKVAPERYGPLHHPGDAFSFDIFSQVGRLARSSRSDEVLGPLEPKRILAVGESQSATFLTTYVNAVDPLAEVYDGFLIHSRFGGAVELGGAMDPGGPAWNGGVQLRPTLRVPVMTFITELDLLGFPGMAGFHAARQPDTERLRVWELPGASHADNYTILVSPIDTGSAPLEDLAKAYAPSASIMGMGVNAPINFGPQHHYVVQAALNALDHWVRTGEPPPRSPRIELTDTAPPQAVRDEHGIAKGGIRTPWTDVPAARLSGEGDPGHLMGALFGTSEIFSGQKLKALYPGGKADYLERFEVSLDETIGQGFILPADRAEILGLAALMYPVQPQ